MLQIHITNIKKILPFKNIYRRNAKIIKLLTRYIFKVVIGDHDGVITCFGIKKGEAMVSSAIYVVNVIVCGM